MRTDPRETADEYAGELFRAGHYRVAECGQGLFTGHRAKKPESVLSGPIFSGPVDCAGLVNFA